ncbi:hypothetical protein QML28_30385, partial [Klebsiella pneumoniae]|uniref:hypothetical protein n=1 Tax=Klebsiella pneumoniae TaxID=573 RepID=UPI003A80C6CE
MSSIPVFQAATVGYPGWAGHVNQFLTPHNATLVYSGSVITTSQTSGSGTFLNTDGQFISQQFVTGNTQTAISQVQIQV